MPSSVYTPVGLATATPSALHRSLVTVVACLMLLLTALLWPRAGDAGPELPVFVGAYQTTVAICDLLTALMLFSQFVQFRTANLLILSCGYLFTAIIVTIHLGSFPGVFATDGIVGGNVSTPPWLWTAWHSVFPAAVLLYAVVRRPVAASPQRAVTMAVMLTVGAIAAAYLFSARYNDLLPTMIGDRAFSPFFLGVLYPLMMTLCIAALAALLFLPAQYPVITLYLMLAVLGFLLDVVNNWHSGARYALGWYLGRANSFVASVSLCMVFVVENAVLLRYANRAAAALKLAKNEAERANDSKSRFLAAASHDLRQPLSALSIYVDALAHELTCAGSKVVTPMKECVANLNDMLSDLLDLSKLDAGAVRPSVCDFAFDAMLTRVMSAHGLEASMKGLALRGRDSMLIGRTDPVLFQRIVGNLVSNAIRYTKRGGVLIGARRRGGKAWVEVWDTGIGIPADKTSEIFEEFKQLDNVERNRAKGSGLGLAIVAKTAALLGLEVSVCSRPGRGSVFAVELPLGEAPSPALQSQYSHRPLRIALVEDDAHVAAALVYALMNAGHQVMSAASRSEILSRLDGVPPQIVISDYRLGGGEDGVDVVSGLRTVFGDGLPAIIITGDTDPAVIARMAKAGIVVHHKPVHLEALRARIAELTS